MIRLATFGIFLFALMAISDETCGVERFSPSITGAIEVFDKEIVARVQTGMLLPGESADIPGCCGSNYTAAWDMSGELIAFVVDTFLCPKKVEDVLRNALLEATWETEEEYLFRNDRLDGLSLRERPTSGITNSQFPGVMGTPISESSLATMQLCVQPLLERALRNSKQYRRFRDVENSKGQRSRLRASIYADKSFYGAVSLPVHLLQPWHEGPHIDSDDEPGLATLYTLSKKEAFEASGTAFTNIPGLPSLLGNGGQFQVQRRLNQLRRENKEIKAGYLNVTRNPFQKLSVLARNKYNRLLLYPTNRLHTGFIPDEELLIPDPVEGRLTMNSFWRVSNSPEHMTYHSIESNHDDM